MATLNNTYTRVGIREDLTDVLTLISPTDTPMFSEFRKTSASNTLHEWQTQALSDAATNAQVEGFTASFSEDTASVRVNNYTQIFAKTLEVSRTTESVKKAGRNSEVAYQAELKMKELARDIEYALVNGTGNAGGGTAASAIVGRNLKGTVSFTTTNIVTAGSAASAVTALTEDHYNDLLQKIFENGGSPTTAYVNGYQKRKISAFTSPGDRNVSTDDKRLVANIDVYESDFGMQEIILDRWMTKGTLLVVDKNMWGVAILDAPKMQDLAKVGDSKRAMIVGELTLEALNEQSGGKITNLVSAT
jgi:hypothetical protein